MKERTHFISRLVLCLMLMQFSGGLHYLHLLQKHVQPGEARQVLVHDHGDAHNHCGNDICPGNGGAVPNLVAKCHVCLTLMNASKGLAGIVAGEALGSEVLVGVMGDAGEVYLSERLASGGPRAPPAC